MTVEQYTQYIIVSVLAGGLALYVAWYVYRRRKAEGAAYFALFMLAICIWSLANTAEILSQSVDAKLLWGKLTYLGVVSVAPLWILFALRYTHSESPWTRKRSVVFWIVPLVIQILVMTNNLHGLVWSAVVVVQTEPFLLIRYEYSVVTWIAMAYFYALLLAGAIVLLRSVLQSNRLFKLQAVLMITGILLPWIVNILYVTRIVSWGDQDLTPLAFVVTGILLAFGLFRYQILDILPIARGQVIEGMSDSMIVLDDDNRLVDMNPAAAALLACNAQDVVGQPVEEVLSKWSSLVERFRNVSEVQEEVFIKRSGWYELRISSLLGGEHHANGRLIVLRDITQRKQSEAELLRYTSELESSNAELDAFAHTVAHDLRNPLAMILGFGDILQEQFGQLTPKEIREYLGYISEGGRKMQNIIDALLLLSSLRRSEEVPFEALDMSVIIRDVKRGLVPLLDQRHASLQAMEQWPTVRGIATWVENVWVNYITNAIKYGGRSDEGVPPSVELGWEYLPLASSKGTRDVRFWVSDNGIGLNEEQKGKLFTPFTRLHLDEPEGHGLGLTIVERIISRLGGTVGVESAPGKGSKFWFVLPEWNSPAQTGE